MVRHLIRKAAVLALVAVGIGFSLPPATSIAGTTGKISGRVADKQGKPVIAATVLLGGTRQGAFTDAQGDYSILNVPPGSYDVTISRMGYKTRVTKGVVVSADNTTRLDAVLDEAALATDEVVVTAERPPVDVGLTSTKMTLSTEEIEALPVQELQDVVNLQAGVVDGHFRGGRTGEVQYQVDGVSVNNAFNNASTLRVDRSLLQEVQVISGTFDAEYGQAMSGVVNAVLKNGSERFEWGGEAFTGGFVFPGRSEERHVSDRIRPASIQNFQATVSGPLMMPKTVYLLSARRYVFDDYLWGERRFVPTDSSDFEHKVFVPTGNGERVALGFSREWSGVAKITNTSFPDLKLSYQAIVNDVEGRRNNFAFRYNPDGLAQQKTFAIVHGLDVTRTLSPTTYVDLSLRQNYLRYSDRAYHNVYDPNYDAAGPPLSDSQYELGAVVQGVEFTRYVQKTDTYLVKGSLVSQVRKDHQVKMGGEISWPKVWFGTPGHLTYTTVDGVEQLVRHDNEPPDYPGVAKYEPLTGAFYVQDQIEWTDLTLRGGLRFEYFDARARIPGDLRNPANAIEGAPPSELVETSAKAVLAPRLGVAYPITERAALHFAYGHFYQFPAIGTIFANADYQVLSRLQAGGISYGVMGNPDVKPEQTVQYEFGYKHAITDDMGLDVTAFYKDIRDLLGVEFITTYSDAEYARLANVDFGSVVGFTVTMDHRKLGPASVALDYTWQLAQGNSSDPRETATRAEAGEDPRPRQIPFNWDQRHTVNMTVSLGEPDVYNASGVLRVASGQPYTPILEAGFGGGLEANSGRKPLGATVDLRAERYFQSGAVDWSVFGRIFNLFDTRFFNGAVYSSTGSPYYSRFPVADEVALADPTRFYPPRRIEVGITVRPGSRQEGANE